MQLLLLLILFAVAGYLMAGSDLRDKVDRTVDRAKTASGKWTQSASSWWRGLFPRKPVSASFPDWVAGPGADSLPDEFLVWFAGLSEAEAADFARALDAYAEGLGYNLALLVAGALDRKPIIKSAFVEAIVVYSDAYRKAREAQQSEEVEEEAASEESKKPAAKRPSRRKRETVIEAAESASAA